MAASPVINHVELNARGFTVVRRCFDKQLCDRLRAEMDRWMGPPTKRIENGVAAHSWQGPDDHAGTALTVRRCLERGHPYITSAHYLHSMRHPIDNPAFAEATAAMMGMHCDLLDTTQGDLRLMQHFARRSDPADESVLPPKGAFGATPESPNPGFHMDAGFLPSQCDFPLFFLVCVSQSHYRSPDTIARHCCPRHELAALYLFSHSDRVERPAPWRRMLYDPSRRVHESA